MHHRIFDIDEILRHIVSCVMRTDERKATINFACCCKAFEEPALSAVWERQNLVSLTRLLPAKLWKCQTSVRIYTFLARIQNCDTYLETAF
jgi:hypothetical protein